MSSRPRSRCGFVLLVVLAAIIVVGLALTSTARRGLNATISAIEAQKSLQRRWGMTSCQRAILPAAQSLFDVSDRTTRRQRGKKTAFPAVLEDRVMLGDQTFDLLVADEDAKANLNAIYDASDIQTCERALSRLTGPLESRSVQLTPERASTNQQSAKKSRASASKLEDPNSEIDSSPDSIAPAFRSWGEVFDLVQLHRLAGDDRQLAKMTRQLSLFGTGRLNVFRAKDETILAVCSAVVREGLAQRVLSKVRETSLGEVRLVLDQTVTNEIDRRDLQKLLGDSSNSFSIWIEVSSKSVRQQRLAIQAPNEIGITQTTEFSFE